MATGTITTGSFPRLLQDGVGKIFGNSLKEHKAKYSMIFDVMDSKKAFEIHVQVEGFNRASRKDEGDDITFDSRQQGFTPKYVHSTFAKGYFVTQEAMEDELYGQFSMGARAMARCMNITRELEAHSILNNGFDPNFTMLDGDGEPLFSREHPNGPSGGTYSNMLPISANLSEASLEDALSLIMQIRDTRRLPASLMARKLVVASGNNAFNAQRILGSVLQNDTANNATNAIRDMGSISDGWMHSPYLTDQDAWFLCTDAPAGLQFFQRVPISFDRDEAFTSGNMRFKTRQRFSAGWDDARGCVGSQGS